MKKITTLLLIFFASSSAAQFKFHWRQISGPLRVTIVDPDSASTLVTGLNMTGYYDFEFSVSNDFGTGYDTCQVVVLTGVLSLKKDTVYHMRPPEIKKLDIKMLTRASDIYIQIKSPRLQTIECALCDITGRRLARIEMKVSKGINYVSIPKPRLPGIYILQFITYFEKVSQKIFF